MCLLLLLVLVLVYSTSTSSTSSTIAMWCQQHVVHRLQTEPLRLLDHAHGTVYQSSSLTAHRLSPSRNISRLIYLVYLFGAQIDCVLCKVPLGCLRVKLHYITLHVLLLFSYMYILSRIQLFSHLATSVLNKLSVQCS